MGLLQIEIAGSKIERKPYYLHSFLHTEKLKYETVFIPNLSGSITDTEDKIICLLFQLKYYPFYCWGFLVQKEASHA